MKGKKPLIALVALLFVGVVGVTFAYFTETETFQTTIWAKSFWFMLLNTNQANSLSCLQRALLFIVYEQVSF